MFSGFLDSVWRGGYGSLLTKKTDPRLSPTSASRGWPAGAWAGRTALAHARVGSAQSRRSRRHFHCVLRL